MAVDVEQTEQGAHPHRRRAGSWVRRRIRRRVRLVAGLALVLLLVLGLLALAPRLLPDLPNPFAVDRVDRTGPAVLHALEGLSEYRAATGHFQVILDVADEARYLPAVLQGERTLFLAAGTVDAVVDFDGLGEDAVEVSRDRTQATIHLPPARLADPRVDSERSYVYQRRRGLLDRIGSMFTDSPTSDRELYLLAEQRLAEAAAETDLIDAAETNTEAMLQVMLGSLGFEQVTVRFDRG